MLERLRDRITGKAPPGAKRSRGWRKVRRKHITDHPDCAVCGGTKRLEVHHVIPFWAAPDLELDPDGNNLITLCRKSVDGVKGLPCHRFVGHLGSWTKVNLFVRADAAYWREKLRS